MSKFSIQLNANNYEDILYDMSFDKRYYDYFLTQQHDSFAQLFIGILHIHGRFVEWDYKKAYEWIKKSVDQNNSHAKNQMGDLYYYGYEVVKDYNEAIKWYKLSAEDNNSYGQLSMGYMFEHGYGVNINHEEALKQYELSANNDNLDAKISVANLYNNGFGCERDFYKAAKIYKNNSRKLQECHWEKFGDSLKRNKFYILNDYLDLKKENDELKTYITHLETLPGSKIYYDAMNEFNDLRKDTF